MEKEDFNALKKRKKWLLIVASIFTILFILVPIGMIHYYRSEKSGMNGETKAIDIIENGHITSKTLNYIYSPEFKYVVDGTEYSCGTKLHTSRKPDKDTTVYYKIDDPSKCITSYELTNYDVYYIPLWFGIFLDLIIAISFWQVNRKLSKL